MVEHLEIGISIRRRLLIGAALAILALLVAGAFTAGEKSAFVSTEVQFTDTSVRGLQIVPASCPSSPHWAGECGGAPPVPWQNGCSISVAPSGITAGESATLSWSTVTRNPYIPAGSITGIGPVAVSGSVAISPSRTTIYTYSGSYNVRSFGGVLIPVGTFSCSASVLVYSGATPCGTYYCTGTRLYYRTPSGRTCVNTLVSTCEYGCSASACLPPPAPTGALSARPLLVRAEETVNVTWSADFVNSCTVTGTNGDRWETRTGNETSGPIDQQTIYTLSCAGVDGSTLTQQVTVGIIPIFQEQ